LPPMIPRQGTATCAGCQRRRTVLTLRTAAGARRQTILFRRAEDLLACMERLLDDPEART
jgi:hypothetical protein